MKIVGCDLHAKQQTIALVDTETGEFTEKTLAHEGNRVREFYAAFHPRQTGARRDVRESACGTSPTPHSPEPGSLWDKGSRTFGMRG
jgi:hypothetical protein